MLLTLCVLPRDSRGIVTDILVVIAPLVWCRCRWLCWSPMYLWMYPLLWRYKS